MLDGNAIDSVADLPLKVGSQLYRSRFANMPDCPINPFPFALIPAAGRSRRMGAPKLLLDAGGQTVIARLLSSLVRAGLSHPVVVLDPADQVLKAEVERHAGRAVVAAAPPPDMRASVSIGLETIAEDLAAGGIVPDAEALWILIPADHPVVLPETVETLLAAGHKHPGSIIVPTYDGRRGHPTVFTWRHASEVNCIPAGEGFNWILKRHAADVVEIAVSNPGVLFDLDTPEDYERLRTVWKF
jgi:molybdenum cofactor cytidylyltransferase